jgi:hypothetical protein
MGKVKLHISIIDSKRLTERYRWKKDVDFEGQANSKKISIYSGMDDVIKMPTCRKSQCTITIKHNLNPFQ